MSIVSLQGKTGLVVGIADARSIAWGCARAFHAAGAQLAATWQSERLRERVQPLLQQLDVPVQQQLDVSDEGQMQALFEAIERQWGKLDFLVHSIAFAPAKDLHGRVVDSSAEGFAQAMDLSCHSFIRMARLAEPLMKDGGSLITMSYLGAEEVMPGYGMMGPVKAALEASVRYLAAELGPSGIRVNAVSPGPLVTRAASGLTDLDRLVQESAERAPLKRPFDIDDVGALSAFLASDAGRSMTGGTLYVDGGFHILN